MSKAPFARLADFGAAVTELVPDTKGGYTDSDFVLEAARRYAEARPAIESQDLGDGSTSEWVLGDAPFGSWAEGFSDQWPVTVEQLDTTNAPQKPQQHLAEGPDFWFERRFVSSELRRYLVFDTAPPAAGKVRVRFRRAYTIDDEDTPTVEVPTHHHLAVVYKACELKCAALVGEYQRSIDPAGGSDIFDANMYVRQYADGVNHWRQEYEKILGLNASAQSFSSGRVRTAGARAWPR